MSTFFEKLFAVIRTAAHYLWIALKALGRGLLWLASKILHLLSDLITWARYNLSPRVQLILIAIIVALMVVGVALVFTGHGCSASTDSEQTPTEEEAPPQVSYTPNELDVQELDYTPNTIESFSLVKSGNQMFATLSEDDNREITSALSWLQADNEDVGFLIMNLNTGSGFCYNIDTKIYGASTYKAPMSVFLCEEYIDGGTLQKSAVSTRIENAIIWSDNQSYRSLKHSFDGSNHNAWLQSMGIDPSNYMSTFPTYSVRDSATIWMHTWDYLNSGSSTAEWLGDLLSSTETSFLRNGTEQAGMNDATVYNKAGWCVSSSGVEDAVSDAGIVVEGDNIYLVVAFTSRPDNPTAEANLSNLFEALLSVRHSLDASSATWDNVEFVEAPAQDEGEEGQILVEPADGQEQYEIVIAPSDDASTGNSQMAQDSAANKFVIVSPSDERLMSTESLLISEVS